MIRRRLYFLIIILILALFAGACSKYSYYYRDKDAKTRDCSKPASTSHKYKK